MAHKYVYIHKIIATTLMVKIDYSDYTPAMVLQGWVVIIKGSGDYPESMNYRGKLYSNDIAGVV